MPGRAPRETAPADARQVARRHHTHHLRCRAPDNREANSERVDRPRPRLGFPGRAAVDAGLARLDGGRSARSALRVVAAIGESDAGDLSPTAARPAGRAQSVPARVHRSVGVGARPGEPAASGPGQDGDHRSRSDGPPSVAGSRDRRPERAGDRIGIAARAAELGGRRPGSATTDPARSAAPVSLSLAGPAERRAAVVGGADSVVARGAAEGGRGDPALGADPSGRSRLRPRPQCVDRCRSARRGRHRGLPRSADVLRDGHG